MNILKSLAFFGILFLTQESWAQDPDLFCLDTSNCCSGKPNGHSFGDWEDCTSYWFCVTETAQPMNCPSNQTQQLYDPPTRKCVAEPVDGCVDGTRPPETVPSSTSTSTPTITSTTSTTPTPGNGNCTLDGTYFVPYPGDCKKYMICSGSQLHPDVQECPSGTLFDPDLGECNLEHLVECRPTCPTNGEIVRFPHDRNCSLYWICDTQGEANLRECPPGLLFDPILQACNIEDQVFCPNLCPEEGLEMLPHSKNCSLYWLCGDGVPTLRQCPDGLLFDPELGQCNIESEVECSVNNGTIFRIPSAFFNQHQRMFNGNEGQLKNVFGDDYDNFIESIESDENEKDSFEWDSEED